MLTVKTDDEKYSQTSSKDHPRRSAGSARGIEVFSIFSFTFVPADTYYAKGNFPCHLIGHLMTTRDRFLIIYCFCFVASDITRSIIICIFYSALPQTLPLRLYRLYLLQTINNFFTVYFSRCIIKTVCIYLPRFALKTSLGTRFSTGRMFEQGHPMSIFGKYPFGRRFEI